jgi:methylthioribose-1-phosphate isomerase
MPIATIEWKNNCARIIDQTKLPLRLVYVDCHKLKCIWDAIKVLKVRGAPAIGIAAAFGVFLGIREVKSDDFNVFKRHLDKVIAYLGSSRPTAVNLSWALKRMREKAMANSNLKIAGLKKLLLQEALIILKEDRQTCRMLADFGSRLVKDNDNCLTICNAGALATADYGTALGVFYRAKEKGKRFKVFACETRPLLQGARLSSWELMKHNINVTLIADNTAGYLMAEGRLRKVFVGADRIAGNGDTANKIGTFNLALLSYAHKIPFYVVAPGSTFDSKLKKGKDIPIEHRHQDEVFKLQSKRVAPVGIKAYNPAFDVTPNEFISAFVTEKGIIHPPFKKNIHDLLA